MASRPRRPRAVPGAFTLVEMLLALAVVALVGGLVLPGVNSMLQSINEETPDRIFLDAVNSARDRALNGNRTVEMRYDKDKRRLSWGDAAGSEEKVLPEGTSLQFLLPKEGPAVLIAGERVETHEVTAVRFYADGTCDRFRAQFRRGTGAALILAMDPWTCAPIATAADEP